MMRGDVIAEETAFSLIPLGSSSCLDTWSAKSLFLFSGGPCEDAKC